MRMLILLSALCLLTPVHADDKHWSFQPLTRPAVPRVESAWAKNPIDAFILERLRAAKLSPAPDADRASLLRRVTFDLTGLPPTPDELDAFLKDDAPNAYETVVERLLASPRYGERWGRHWLDLAPYADTNGYEFDEPRPDAWRYRDYVIESFNADKPFDRFIVEQLAGDEAFPGDRAARVATGFNLLGPDMTDSSDQTQRRQNTLNDMTDTVSLAFLGLTVGCARCHDHKSEPIPQADYYRLQAFFAPAVFRKDLSVSTPEESAARLTAQREYDEATRDIRTAIARLETPHRLKLFEGKLARLSEEARAAHNTAPEKRTGGQQELVAETARLVVVTEGEIQKVLPAEDRKSITELRLKLKSFDAQKPPPGSLAMGLIDAVAKVDKTFILERGELANRAEEVQPGFLRVLSEGRAQDATITKLPNSTGRRLTLAKWIASNDNPLTPRVIVNRLWQQHFGRGLVSTPSDFGLRGERPTHPELLDWLASEFIDPRSPKPWSLKRIHKLMLLSATYRQSTQVSAAAKTIDRDNRLYSRMNRLRLEGEAVRDALLSVSGMLNRKSGGPGVVLPEAAAAVGGSRPVPVTKDSAEYTRRSVYLFSRRNLRLPFLEAFDLPDSNLSCPKRERSTTAPQALTLLNSPEVRAAAAAMSERLMKTETTEIGRIDLAYRLAFSRPPTDAEHIRAAAFLKQSPLSELCRALLNLNEFVYLD
jgi:hypothetical protein